MATVSERTPEPLKAKVESEESQADGPAELRSELDPPPGARRGWLDSALAKHRFIVLVFYRGFW